MARSSRLAPLIFAGWLAFLPVPSAGEEDRPPAGSGPVIASISFQVPSPYQVTYEECYGLVTLRPGDRLTEEKVRESIRRLYTRSVFREVTAYVREDGGKAHLLFFLRPVPLVAEIEVSGQKSVTAAQIISSSRIRRGGPLEERDLAEAETAVRAFLAGRGFTAGKCTIQVSCSVVNGAGKVRITVEEGMPGLVGTLAIPGAAFFPPERIARDPRCGSREAVRFPGVGEGPHPHSDGVQEIGVPDRPCRGIRAPLRGWEQPLPESRGSGGAEIRRPLGRCP